MKMKRTIWMVLAIVVAMLMVVGCATLFEQSEARSVRERIAIEASEDSYIKYGADIKFYSDNKATQKLAIDGATGNVDIEGTLDVNSTSDLKGNLADSGGAFTIADNVLIDGAADAVQLTVQGYTTQTSNLLVAETSAGTDKFTVDNSGNIAVAGTSDLVGNVSDSGGAFTVADNVMIDGAADAIQLTVQGNATQTSNLLVLEQSDGTDKLTVSNDGNVDIVGTLQYGANNLYALGYASSGQQAVYGSSTITTTATAAHGLTTVTFALCTLGEDPETGVGDAALCTVAISSNVVTLKTWQDDFSAATEADVVVHWLVIGAP